MNPVLWLHIALTLPSNHPCVNIYTYKSETLLWVPIVASQNYKPYHCTCVQVYTFVCYMNKIIYLAHDNVCCVTIYMIQPASLYLYDLASYVTIVVYFTCNKHVTIEPMILCRCHWWYLHNKLLLLTVAWTWFQLWNIHKTIIL